MHSQVYKPTCMYTYAQHTHTHACAHTHTRHADTHRGILVHSYSFIMHVSFITHVQYDNVLRIVSHTHWLFQCCEYWSEYLLLLMMWTSIEQELVFITETILFKICFIISWGSLKEAKAWKINLTGATPYLIDTYVNPLLRMCINLEGSTP